MRKKALIRPDWLSYHSILQINAQLGGPFCAILLSYLPSSCLTCLKSTCYMLLFGSNWSMLNLCQWIEFDYFPVFIWFFYFLCIFAGEYFVFSIMSYVKSAVLFIPLNVRSSSLHSLTVKIANQILGNFARISIASFSLSFFVRIYHFWSSSPTVCQAI